MMDNNPVCAQSAFERGKSIAKVLKLVGVPNGLAVHHLTIIAELKGHCWQILARSHRSLRRRSMDTVLHEESLECVTCVLLQE